MQALGTSTKVMRMHMYSKPLKFKCPPCGLPTCGPPPPRRHTYATTHTPRPQLRDSGEDGVQGRLGLAQLLKGGGLGLRAQGKVKGLHLTTFKQA